MTNSNALRQLLLHLRGKVSVVWDNGDIYKDETIPSFLRRHRRLRFEYLPPCASELNPD